MLILLDQGPMLRTSVSSEDNDIWLYYFIVDAERAKLSASRIFLIFKLKVSCPRKPLGPQQTVTVGHSKLPSK